MKYKFLKNSGTYMYKKETIILKATDILAVHNFWMAKEVNKELKKKLLHQCW